MLKIYLMKITYKIQNKDEVTNLKSYSNFTLEEESAAVPTTKEYSVYADNIYKLYLGYYNTYAKKKGKLTVLVGNSDTVYLKEWKCPDAKLIISISYEETECSMERLFRMDSDKVIAYLKQEGIILPTPS